MVGGEVKGLIVKQPSRLFHDGESGADPHRTYRPKLWEHFSCKMNILMFQEMFSTALRVRENPVA